MMLAAESEEIAKKLKSSLVTSQDGLQLRIHILTCLEL